MSLNADLGRDTRKSSHKPVPAQSHFWWTSSQPSWELSWRQRNQELKLSMSGLLPVPLTSAFLHILSLESFSVYFWHTWPRLEASDLKATKGFIAYWLSIPVHNSKNRITHLFFQSLAIQITLSSLTLLYIPCGITSIYLLSVFPFECQVHEGRDTIYLVPRTVPVTW